LLPYILPSQAQKHVTHNEAIRRLDSLIQIAVHSRVHTTPPTSPENGDRYIVAANASNEWAGKEGEIAAFQDGAWAFLTPATGWLVWVSDENALIVKDASSWATVNADQQSASRQPGSNHLINGDFQINQRGFSGGFLSAGTYGYDRWKASTTGTDISVSGDIVTLAEGQILQVIETPSLEDKQVTVSLEDLSGGNIDVEIETQTATLIQGSGRIGHTFTLPSSATGNISVGLSPSNAAVEFSRVKLETGSVATEWSSRPIPIEFALAQRYYERLSGQSNDRYIRRAYGTNTGPQYYPIQFFARKRIAPTISLIQISNSNSSSAQAFNPSFYEFEFYHNVTAAGGFTYFGYEADAEL